MTNYLREGSPSGSVTVRLLINFFYSHLTQPTTHPRKEQRMSILLSFRALVSLRAL